MKVFISWSGKLSGSVAILLGKWLPNVIQAVTPFVSSEDIPKGTRWFEEIFKELKISNCGLICLTRDNVNKPWIAFEAGALLKSVDRSLVIPLLIDFPLNELKDHPLALFQAATFSKDDVYKIVCSINNNLGDRSLTESILKESFEKWWPDLNEGVQKAVEESQAYLHLNKKLQEKFEEDFGLWNDFKGNHIMWPPEEFYSISEYYRKANQDLNDDKLAFLLTQAVQHGGNDFRYWVEKNHYNKRAVEYLIKALIKAQKEGWKRVGWRATFALQNIDSKIIDEFITKASEEIVHILQKIRSERVEDTLYYNNYYKDDSKAAEVLSQIGLIFFDDYTDPVVTKGQWIQIGGEWGITDRGYGVIEFNRTGDTEVLANTDRLYNFIFEVEFELIKETIGFLLRTSYDAKSGYMIQFFKNGLIRRHVKEDGGYPKERIQDIRPKESISSKDGTYFAKFILRENCIETAITSGDVKIEDEWLDDTYKGGKVGFRFSGTGEENGLIKKVRVYKI